MFDRFIKSIASLKLTVVCLCFALLLVFLGTIAQVDEGLYNAQSRYFRSVFVYWSPHGADWRVPVFPGGYLIGAVLLLNLITAYAERFKPAREKSGLGLYLTHGGLVLLVIGQFATDLLQVESMMRIVEGQPKNYSEASANAELAVVEVSNPQFDDVVAIPERHLERNDAIAHPKLPFTIRVKKLYPNSALADRPKDATEPPPATQGFGPQLKLSLAPPVVRMDDRNIPSAVLELATPKGSLGTWVVSTVISQPQSVTVDNRTFELTLRPTRYYEPYSLTLLKFSHDKYLGTSIAKNFSSRVRLQKPDTGEDREVLIYMNNPLRYAGKTYYQASFDPNDPRVSVLQVVRNPGWLTPYLSCVLVSAGLIIQFMAHLFNFVKKRRTV